MWETREVKIVWAGFATTDGGLTYVRLDQIEAYGKDWIRTLGGHRYEGLRDVPAAMAKQTQ